MGELPVFKQTFNVEPNQIDDLNHVNNVVYVQWVNDIAVAHWKEVATEYLLETYNWFLIKHTIEYKSAAVLGDTIQVSTYVGRATNVRYERFVEIRNAKTDELLVKSTSDWCAVDHNGKPQRITDELRRVFEVS